MRIFFIGNNIFKKAFFVLIFLLFSPFLIFPVLSCDSFNFDYPKSGAQLSGKISAGGKHKCNSEDHIWIALFDGHGYYIQYPPVGLYADGTWDHDNIHLGGGIKKIIAIKVTKEGHKKLLNDKIFGQRQLPDSTVMLTKLPIKNSR